MGGIMNAGKQFEKDILEAFGDQVAIGLNLGH
jgi:hypothetical protein